MLSQNDNELIAAAVDGDLTPDRQAAFRRLIAESAAAHALYVQLCRDRAAVRSLPRLPAPPTLLDGVMARVREASRTSVPARPAPVPVRRPAWLPVSLAASVFLTVGGASFLFFQSRATATRTTAENHALPKDGTASASSGKAIARKNREVTPQPRTVDAPPAVARVDSPRRTTFETAPAPRSTDADRVLTSPPAPDSPLFDAVNVRLPVLVPLDELATEDAKRRVVVELGRDGAVFRIDLFAADHHRATDAFVSAAKAVNLSVAVDAITQERLRKRLPFAWAVVVECLTPAEAADWIAAARTELDPSLPAGRVTGAAHLVAAVTEDQKAVEKKEWKDLFGVDARWSKRSRVDTTPKPISSGTADQVANSIQRSGSASKPDRHALLVTYLPKEGRVNAALSKEVKQYAERRGERKPNTIPLLIVVRPSGQ